MSRFVGSNPIAPAKSNIERNNKMIHELFPNHKSTDKMVIYEVVSNLRPGPCYAVDKQDVLAEVTRLMDIPASLPITIKTVELDREAYNSLDEWTLGS